MLPLGAGRPAFWSLRRSLIKKKADPNTFNKIIASDASIHANSPKIPRNLDEFNNNNLDLTISHSKISALRALNDLYNVKNNQCNPDSIKQNSPSNFVFKNSVIDVENNEIIAEVKQRGMNEQTERGIDVPNTQKSNIEFENTMANVQELPKERTDWFDYSEVGKWVQKSQECLKHELKNEEDDGKSFNELLTQVAELDEIYADTHTKMLQNSLTEPNDSTKFMEVDVCDNQTYTSLQMAMKNPIQLDFKEERKYEDVAIPSRETSAPPLPPPPLAAKRDLSRAYDQKLPPLPPKRIRKMPSMPVLPRTSSFHMDNENTEAPHKNLPSLPGTLNKPTRQNLFSKLFAKKSKKDKEFSVELMTSTNSLKDSQDFDGNSLPRPSMASVTSVKSFDLNGDESPPYGIELTEAEHYALYTAMAPHATASEFDELSFYYSPVEGGKILTDTKEG